MDTDLEEKANVNSEIEGRAGQNLACSSSSRKRKVPEGPEKMTPAKMQVYDMFMKQNLSVDAIAQARGVKVSRVTRLARFHYNLNPFLC